MPDYCIELSMTVEGWEDITINDAEKKSMNILRRAMYRSSCNIPLGWKAVKPGSIKLVFILTEPIDLKMIGSTEELLLACKESRVINIQVDGDTIVDHGYSTIPKNIHKVCYHNVYMTVMLQMSMVIIRF